MTTSIVTERGILPVVAPLVGAARTRVWVTAPWVTTSAAELFFADLIARMRAGEQLDVRIVYRLKGADAGGRHRRDVDVPPCAPAIATDLCGSRVPARP